MAPGIPPGRCQAVSGASANGLPGGEISIERNWGSSFQLWGYVMNWFANTVNHTFYSLQMFLRRAFVDFQPHEYCISAVFVIAIGFVLMSGRR